jgi:hypothetical protein
MKKTLSIIGLFALLALPLAAQTNTPQSFFTTATSWLTSQDTNSTTFLSDTVDLWAGADYQSGVAMDANFGAEVPIYKSIAVESVTRNAGIAGTIVSQQAGLCFNIVHYDIKFLAGLDFGYSFVQKDEFVAPFLQLEKAMTQNTFAYIRLEQQFFLSRASSNIPLVGVGVGVTF